MMTWRVAGALVALLLGATPGQAQSTDLVQSEAVASAALDSDAAARAVRASYAACRPLAVQRLTARLDRGPDAGAGGDLIALVDADCRRGPTQFVFIGLDASAEAPDEVLLHLLPRIAYQGLALDQQTRRLFGRTPRGLEEIGWQRLTRDHLFRLRKPLREYAGLILPPVPAGPTPAMPPLPSTAAAPPAATSTAPAPSAAATPAPALTDATARAQLEAEIRAALEPTLREEITRDVRQEVAAEVQARLDRARGIVEGLNRDIETERATIAQLRAELAARDEALGRERAARETAERLLGLAQAAERDREARAVAERALQDLRSSSTREVEAARAAVARAEEEIQRLRTEADRLRAEAEARAAQAQAPVAPAPGAAPAPTQQ